MFLQENLLVTPKIVLRAFLRLHAAQQEVQNANLQN